MNVAQLQCTLCKTKKCREAIETKNKHAISYLLEALLFSGAQLAKKE